MIGALRSWWEHLGYCWNKRTREFRTFGVRPWRGAPFFWFIIDNSNTARQSKRHMAECDECVPSPSGGEK